MIGAHLNVPHSCLMPVLMSPFHSDNHSQGACSTSPVLHSDTQPSHQYYTVIHSQGVCSTSPILHSDTQPRCVQHVTSTTQWHSQGVCSTSPVLHSDTAKVCAARHQYYTVTQPRCVQHVTSTTQWHNQGVCSTSPVLHSDTQPRCVQHVTSTTQWYTAKVCAARHQYYTVTQPIQAPFLPTADPKPHQHSWARNTANTASMGSHTETTHSTLAQTLTTTVTYLLSLSILLLSSPTFFTKKGQPNIKISVLVNDHIAQYTARILVLGFCCFKQNAVPAKSMFENWAHLHSAHMWMTICSETEVKQGGSVSPPLVSAAFTQPHWAVGTYC